LNIKLLKSKTPNRSNVKLRLPAGRRGGFSAKGGYAFGKDLSLGF
jgi:hypothetical protein